MRWIRRGAVQWSVEGAKGDPVLGPKLIRTIIPNPWYTGRALDVSATSVLCWGLGRLGVGWAKKGLLALMKRSGQWRVGRKKDGPHPRNPSTLESTPVPPVRERTVTRIPPPQMHTVPLKGSHRLDRAGNWGGCGI